MLQVGTPWQLRVQPDDVLRLHCTMQLPSTSELVVRGAAGKGYVVRHVPARPRFSQQSSVPCSCSAPLIHRCRTERPSRNPPSEQRGLVWGGGVIASASAKCSPAVCHQAGGLGDNDERCLGWLWYYPDSAMRLTSFVDTMEGTEVFDPTVSG